MKFKNKYSLKSQYMGVGTLLTKKKAEFPLRIREAFIKPIDLNIRTVSIVGCGHSGTTLMAGKLSRLSSTFVIGHETGCFFPVHSLMFAKEIFKKFSCEAIESGAVVLIEKTPKHVHSFRRIKKVLPENLFICVVRNPLDTVASLFKRMLNLDDAINRWIIDNTELLKYRKRGNSIIIKYETLTLNPEIEFSKLCSFLQLEYSDTILLEGKTCFDEDKTLTGNMIKRRNQVNRPIVPRINSWKGILSQKEAKYVMEKTISLLEAFEYKYNENLELEV